MIKILLKCLLYSWLSIIITASFCHALNLNNKCYKSINPYFKSGYGGQCTAFAWGRTCEKKGIKLIFNNKSYPSAKYWYLYGPVSSLNIEKGNIPKKDSIAVWEGDTINLHGHVAYVEKVSESRIWFNEANVDTLVPDNKI